MVNWKELGEIPDSEDEAGFESQQSGPQLVETSHAISSETDLERDIWDFPDSVHDGNTPTSHIFPVKDLTFDSASSSPLSSVPSEGSFRIVAGAFDDLSDGFSAPAQRPNLPATAPSSPSRSLLHPDSPIESTSQTKPHVAHGDVSIYEDPKTGRDANSEALRVAVRYERSLRPRKPIQEHPYLLESAQFSSTWKMHGLKPMRMASELERTKGDELSRIFHDRGFEEDSQESPQLPPSTSLSPSKDVIRPVPAGLGVSSSAPLRNSPTSGHINTSSPPSSQAETDITSLFDQDLPALDDLLLKPPRLFKSKTEKRYATSPKSSTRKRRRRTIIDSDPIDSDSFLALSTRLSPNSPPPDSPSLSRTLHPGAGEKLVLPSLHEEPELSRDREFVEQHDVHEISDEDDITMAIVLDDDHPDLSDSATISESEGEAVTAMSRRIRGVLPASWLRLDQQTGREKAEKTVRNDHRPRGASMKEGRRGVAQLRHTVPGSTAIPDLFEYSDNESSSLPLATHDDHVDVSMKPALHAVESLTSSNTTTILTIDEDDDGDSVIEDNRVDFMAPPKVSKKRQSKSSVTTNDKKSNASSRGAPTPSRRLAKSWQTKITAHLTEPGDYDAGAWSSAKRKKTISRADQGRAPRKIKSYQVKRRPPKLGILDIIQPDAPHFLKIAARTARSRTSQGRSCPRTKTIQLATRQDQIDAVSVLNQWRSGSLKQRSSVTEVAKSLRGTKKSRTALEESSGNQARQVAPPPEEIVASRNFVKHVSAGGSIRYLTGHNQSGRPSVKHVRRRNDAQDSTALKTTTRPAQLETDEPYRMTKSGFHSRKKFLDNLYQHGISTPSLKEPETRYPSDAEAVSFPLPVQSGIFSGPRPEQFRRDKIGPRCRKRTLPRKIDISAPQYSHANDPVPHGYSAEIPPVTNLAAGKLHGLGPYGTQYTHHFEIFPLQPGVFFHESTLIGGGHLQACAALSFPIDWTESRPRVSLILNTHVLRWGPWNAQVSSEFGVVLDFVADQLESQLADPHKERHNDPTPVQAMDLLLNYVKGSLSFVEESHKLSFVSRTRECIHCFNDRIGSAVQTAFWDDDQNIGVISQLYDRLLLTSLVVLKICRMDPNLVAESFALEDLLKSIANISMSILTKLGFENLQSLYIELGNPDIRDVGIRDETPAVHSWVMNMRVLELAQIPRCSFWDLLQQHIGPKRDALSSNAQDHERIWQNMFMLLPLVEFSHSGVLLAGKRHEATCDGWAIPQGLIKKVFELYNANSRQGASFNSYCRALVGRCHFLVQEWGWRKCVSVIGMIFDFFGAHQLAHLRNEEVYKSPSFLENLAGRTTLHIEPEDRCFHVFLKLVAVAIRKSRDAGCLKDVGNLVARTVPNHIRKHNKDEKVHERDLAALRNHHDLLCTLFWAAPLEYRPSPTLIQHLVVPATSHKEACLINLRAWNQLSRYVIASGEAGTLWKPFHTWRNAFFDQVLQQYNSVASDVALQLATLGKEASNSISKEMVRATIFANKAALMDILYASASASLDVVRHATDLASATFAMNRVQMRTIFTHFSASPPDLDWGILRTSLATLEIMLTKIDDFKASEGSQQSESQLLNSAVADDALLALDQELSQSFFSMARCVLSTRGKANSSLTAKTGHDDCMEHVVIVAARISMRFVNGGLIRLYELFNKSKYQLFNALPHQLDLDHRRHLTLFISTLLQYDIDDFDNAGFDLTELWVSCLVKPRMSLRYELQLGQELCRHGVALVPDTIAGLCTLPDYNVTRELFEYSISYMRKSLRDAGPTLHKTLSAEYSSALKMAMEQMKSDLRTTSQMPAEHTSYVMFAQNIISLIKTHASEICAVDNYFYQISKEYSPPAEDPQLQVASLVSYGLRLQDGDGRISQSLFYLLFNNAKLSIVNNKVDEQIEMLLKGTRNGNIKNFILCKMLPSIINVAFAEPDASPLLDIYLEALRRCFAAKVVSRELLHEDTAAICILLRTVWNVMGDIRTTTETLTLRQLYLIRQMLALQNLVWPSIHVLSASKPTTESWASLREMLECLWGVFRITEGCLKEMGADEWDKNEEIPASRLFAEPESLEVKSDGFDPDIQTFTESMIQDPDGAQCRNIVLHGTEATGKSSITEQLLVRLAGSIKTASQSGGYKHVTVNAAQCITGRHLFERIVGSVADTLLSDGDLGESSSTPRRHRRCETLAQLCVAMSTMLKDPTRDPRWRLVLVLDAIDRQRDAPPTLLPGLARLSEIMPCLTCIFIVTAPPAGFLRTPASAHLHFPPYTKPEFVRILSLSPPAPIPSLTQQEANDLWTRFCAAVHDAFVRSASRTLPSFRHSCQALWPRFIAPVLAGTNSHKEFSKLLVAVRVQFQDESLLNPSIVAVRPDATSASTPGDATGKDGRNTRPNPTTPTSLAAADLTALLPIAARLLLLAAYLASHNGTKHDLTLFSTYHHGRKRRRGGGFVANRGTPRSKHRKIARKLLGAHAFVLERMMAIFEAVRGEWAPDGSAVGASGLDGDIGMAMATLASLRLLVRVGTGDLMDRAGKWRINVGWEAIRGIGRSIGVEVEEWLIE
ncbi:hypothetical protein C2857_002228 [Epichloe festucae Fl1]|uniref:Mus7/MMS22 family protein n=1 Tax=Epichloe festucae (strain Fl1) TaxID=877507 RepID=A0A7S9PRR0_EPIFF|nr:hypothetical protein C2857_002228 [Epichloe festucae Fl1]